MSAWKALYVIPLVGISLAATAQTQVDYQYEEQEPQKAWIVAEGNEIPDDKDNEKSWRMKNLKEGKISSDEDNGSMTLTYYNTDLKECKVTLTGLDFSKNVFIVNGALVNEGLFDIAMQREDVVLINSYLKNGNKIRAAVYPTEWYVTGTVNINDQRTVTIKPSVKQDGKADMSGDDPVIVVNGERMSEDFDMNSINPNEITSISVLKDEQAMKEYGTDKGVIVIMTDPSKADEKKPVPDIYIDGKKATSEEIAALPANPKGTISTDGTVWITTEDKTVEKPNPDEVVYVVTDKAAELIQNREPRFQGGGMPEFQKWVHDHIKYPEGVTSEGRVDVSFTVSKDGGVTDVKILRGADAKLNEEAIRVIESSSNGWVPAIKDGKKIPITMMLPVIFKK